MGPLSSGNRRRVSHSLTNWRALLLLADRSSVVRLIVARLRELDTVVVFLEPREEHYVVVSQVSVFRSSNGIRSPSLFGAHPSEADKLEAGEATTMKWRRTGDNYNVHGAGLSRSGVREDLL